LVTENFACFFFAMHPSQLAPALLSMEYFLECGASTIS